MHLYLYYGTFLPYFFIDRYYIIYVLPAMLIALWAQFNVQSTYNRYSRVFNSRGLTGAQVARQILDRNGLYSVSIQRINGNLTDNYNPRTNVISLSPGVFDGRSVASLGVAAHECGHAIQHNVAYKPLLLRNAIIPVTQFGSSASIWILIIGFIFNWGILVTLGIVLFSLAVVFQLITLPVEFNASRRALNILDEGGMLFGDELRGARKVLKAAALTYVAATIVAFAQLLRVIAIFGNSRRD
jgi:Zn-dependent membrane protease YugP